MVVTIEPTPDAMKTTWNIGMAYESFINEVIIITITIKCKI